MHHGIPAVLHRDEPWLHRHSENGALRDRNANFREFLIGNTLNYKIDNPILIADCIDQ